MTVQVLEKRLLMEYALAAGTDMRHQLREVEELIKWVATLPAELQEDLTEFLLSQEELEKVWTLIGSRKTGVWDSAVDRTIGRCTQNCSNMITVYENSPLPLEPPEQQRLEDARLVRESFPEDIRDLLLLAYVREWIAVRGILQKTKEDKEFAAAIDRLGMSIDFAFLARLHVEYGKSLGITDESKLEKFSGALERWHKAYENLMLSAAYFSRRLNNPLILQRFQAPYLEQLANQRAEERRRRERSKESSS